MPPYSEVVFYDNTLRRLEPKHIGLLCWLIAHAEPLGNGAWGMTDTTHENIAAALGISENTLGGWLKVLAATGFIHTTKQKGRGRHNGGSSQTHYLTYHPALPRPDHTPDPDGEPRNRELKNRELKERGLKKGDLYVLPSREPALASAEVEKFRDQHACLSESSTTEQTPAPQEPMPPAVRDALASIGWDFRAFAVPADTDWEALMSVIAYTKRQAGLEKKAGFVNSRLRLGIRDEAEALNLLNTTSTQRRSPAALTALEYDTLAEAHPDWDKEIRAAAAARAREQNRPYLPPSLKWQMAVELGLPDSETTLPPDSRATALPASGVPATLADPALG